MSLLDVVHRIFGQRVDSFEMTLEHNRAMALAVRDDNPIHCDEVAARKANYEHTPALGIHLILLAEEHLDELRHDLSKNGRSGYELARLAVKVPHPVYPGQRVQFLCNDDDNYVENEHEVRFSFRGVVFGGTPEHLPVIESEAWLTHQPISFRPLPSVHYRKREPITGESLDIINGIIGRKRRDIVPYGMVAASFVSALLDLGKRAVAVQYGPQHPMHNYGVIRSLELCPYARPMIGSTLESSLYVRRRRPQNDLGPYLYTVEGLVQEIVTSKEGAEEKAPLLFGELRCVSSINFSKVYEQ